MICTSSSFRPLTIARGVAAGTNIAVLTIEWNSGSPASATGGTSGMKLDRSSPIARARCLPDLT
nr:hypothetical protein [Caenimonas soli]